MIRLSAIFLVVFSASVFARPVTITYEGVASGSLDGTAFTNVAFTIVGYADTTDVVGTSCSPYVVHQSTTVALEGLGKFSFLTDGVTGYGSNRNGTGLSFMHSSAPYSGLIDLQKSPCVNDDLFSYQVVNSSMNIRNWEDGGSASPVMTDGGRLIFNDDINNNSQGSRTLTYPPAQPIPAMPIYPLVVLAGLLALFGFYRVRASK